MRCVAKPTIAEALPIVGVVLVVQTGKRRTYLELQGDERNERVPLTADVVLHAAPKRGDVFITLENGERQVVTQEVFDQRYQFIHQRG